MTRRFDDALAIQVGACNPSGIAHSIVDACREARDEMGFTGTENLYNDPAIRLMVHQLAYLCKVREIDDDLLLYGQLVGECERRKDNVVHNQ